MYLSLTCSLTAPSLSRPPGPVCTLESPIANPPTVLSGLHVPGPLLYLFVVG
jgi:hypothetical protein